MGGKGLSVPAVIERFRKIWSRRQLCILTRVVGAEHLIPIAKGLIDADRIGRIVVWGHTRVRKVADVTKDVCTLGCLVWQGQPFGQRRCRGAEEGSWDLVVGKWRTT